MTPSDHLLRTFAAIPPATRILDAGCGQGRHLVPLAQLGFDVWGCDTDADALADVCAALDAAGLVGGNSATLLQQDAARLDVPDDTFGWVVACGLLDGYSDAERAALLEELRRVLAPGGWLYVTAKADPEKLATWFEQAGFAVAEAPRHDPQEEATRAIFRRVEPGTIA